MPDPESKLPAEILGEQVRVALSRHGITDVGLHHEIRWELMFSREQFAIDVYKIDAAKPDELPSFRTEVVDLLGARREGAADYNTLGRIARLSEALAAELAGLSELRAKTLEQASSGNVEDLARAISELNESARRVMAEMGEPRRDPERGRPTSVEGEESLRLFQILSDYGVDGLRPCSRIVAEILKETGRSDLELEALSNVLFQRFRNHRLIDK